jgi:preprotein translocase subunit SecG
MGYFLMVVILVVCVLLGAVILVQNPKGGGLATGFQGAGQVGGVQRTVDFLEKATWYLTGALFVLCIVAGMFFGNATQDVGIDESILPTTSVPAGGAVDGGSSAGE